MTDQASDRTLLGRVAIIVAVLAGIATTVSVGWTIFHCESTAVADYRKQTLGPPPGGPVAGARGAWARSRRGRRHDTSERRADLPRGRVVRRDASGRRAGRPRLHVGRYEDVLSLAQALSRPRFTRRPGGRVLLGPTVAGRMAREASFGLASPVSASTTCATPPRRSCWPSAYCHFPGAFTFRSAIRNPTTCSKSRRGGVHLADRAEQFVPTVKVRMGLGHVPRLAVLSD